MANQRCHKLHNNRHGEEATGIAGNVLVGGLIGAGVDVASGAMLDLTPNPIVVKMVKKGDVAVAGSAGAGQK